MIRATLRFLIVTFSLPYWPAILTFLSTRPGVMFEPIEPPWRLYSCVP